MQARRAFYIGLLLCTAASSACAHAGGLEFSAPAVGLATGLVCGAIALLVVPRRRVLFKLAAALALLALVGWLIHIEPEALSHVDTLLFVLVAFLFVYVPFLFGFFIVQSSSPRSRRWRRLRELGKSNR